MLEISNGEYSFSWSMIDLDANISSTRITTENNASLLNVESDDELSVATRSNDKLSTDTSKLVDNLETSATYYSIYPNIDLALITGDYSSNITDYHFYLRNGNGTCPNGHGGTCSMWSHKPGTQMISCKGTVFYVNDYLCDKNINHAAKDGYSNVCGPYFYTITKDTNIYNSWHGDGRNSINNIGTPYRP